jgi:tRNA-intron endonuclease
MIKAYITEETIFSNESEAFSLFSKSQIGEKSRDNIIYMFSEALYLLEKKKLELYKGNKKLSSNEALKLLQKKDKKVLIKYLIYKDLRDKGYIPKTALKFGADFRIYKKGHRPGEQHAEWLLYSVHESKSFRWQEFTAKNRVAHSTKKKLLIAIVDEEEDISYYEIDWKKI